MALPETSAEQAVDQDRHRAADRQVIEPGPGIDGIEADVGLVEHPRGETPGLAYEQQHGLTVVQSGADGRKARGASIGLRTGSDDGGSHPSLVFVLRDDGVEVGRPDGLVKLTTCLVAACGGGAMLDESLDQCALGRDPIDDIQTPQWVGQCEPRTIHDVEVIDGGRDLFALAVDDRLVHQGDGELRGHVARIGRLRSTRRSPEGRRTVSPGCAYMTRFGDLERRPRMAEGAVERCATVSAQRDICRWAHPAPRR